MDMSESWELAFVVALKNIESCSGDKVVARIEGNVVGALSFVGNGAVQRRLRGRRRCIAVNFDMELEPD